MLVSPTEYHVLRLAPSDWESSSLPEKYGADYMFASEGQGLVGVQRKEIKDLVASVHDNRLSREVAQLTDGRLQLAVLIIEGQIQWTNTGQSLSHRGEWTRAMQVGLELSLQQKGIWIMYSSSLLDTIESLSLLKKWCQKTEHRLLETRNKTRRDGVFGTVTRRESNDLHFLQGLEGISVTRAKAILNHFNRLPLRWACTVEDMSEVPGIGKGTAAKIIEAFGTIQDEAEMDEVIYGSN